jgi:hypothetical protein
MSISSNDLSGTINSGFNSGGNTFQIGFIIHTSNNLINQDTYNSNILFNYSSNNSNNLSDFIKNTSYNLTSSTSNNSNSSNLLFNYSLTNSNNLANYTSNLSLTNSNNLANYVLNNSNYFSNLSLTNSNNLVIYTSNTSLTNSNNLANYVLNNSNYFSNLSLTNSNNLVNYTSNISLTNSNNLANYILNNSNYFANLSLTNSNNLINYSSNISLTNSNNLANYVLNNSNIFNNKLNSINTDTLTQGSSNRFIVNDIYNRNITFTNNLITSNITTSNLNVIGDSTVLNTTIYQTEQLQVVNDTTATALIVKQVNINKNVGEFYYQNNLLGLVINSNGNVGIGITNPLNKLDVSGNINTTGLLLSGININATITNVSNNLINQDLYNSNNLINQITYTSNILATSSVNSLNSGGTITGRLTLSTSVDNPLSITSTNISVNNCINIKNNLSYNAYIGVGGSAYGGNYANNFFIESSSSSIIFNTNGRTSASTPNMIINSTGNVGIGTLTANNIFQIGNAGRLRIANDINDYTIIGTLDTDGITNTRIVLSGNTRTSFAGNIEYFATSTGTHKFMVNNTSQALTILSNGNVGIGTTNPTNILQIGNSGRLKIGSGTTDYTLMGTLDTDGTTNTKIVLSGNTCTLTGATGSIQHFATASGGHIFYCANNEKVRISNDGTITTTNNIDCGGGIALTGSTGFFSSGPVDAGNLTNTYINFKFADTGNDWCYLRQIGGNNAFKLAFDFHDDSEARFCIRSIESTLTPDNIIELFTVDNGTVTCTGNLGVGTISPPVKLYVNGDIASTGNITAYYSDIRLKNIHSNIENPLDIINNLNGFYYTPNDLANSFGIKKNKMEIGLSAQDVQKVLPELINIAPFDMELDDDGNIKSKSGNNYLTISYERLVPILIEGIKEQNKKLSNLENELNKIKSLLHVIN